MIENKEQLFEEAKLELPMKVFDFSTEIVVFNRGFRMSCDKSTGDIHIYNMTYSTFYSNISDGELDLLKEHGFKKGTAILQLFKCKNDLERVTYEKKSALETNNGSQANYYDRKRTRLLKKQKSIKLYLQDC